MLLKQLLVVARGAQQHCGGASCGQRPSALACMRLELAGLGRKVGERKGKVRATHSIQDFSQQLVSLDHGTVGAAAGTAPVGRQVGKGTPVGRTRPESAPRQRGRLLRGSQRAMAAVGPPGDAIGRTQSKLRIAAGETTATLVGILGRRGADTQRSAPLPGPTRGRLLRSINVCPRW